MSSTTSSTRPQQLGDPRTRSGSAPWPPARAWCTGDARAQIAPLSEADRRPGSDTSSAPSTGNGLRRAASPRPPPAHGRRSAGRRAHRGSARARLHTAPGRALDGAAGARELTSDDGRSSPVTRPVLGRPAPRRAVGPRSRARSVFEVQSQQPGNFSLHVQDRVRGVQLVLQASHLRLERAHLRIQRVAFGRFRAALLRGQLPREPLRRALRQAVRCELYNPSRRSRRPTSPGCVQRSASSRTRSRYSAVNWRRWLGHNLRVRGLARPALGASSLRSSTPRAGTETSFNVIESLSAVIGFHLHRPTGLRQ